MSESDRLFIIGAAKAGTTTLYHALKSSPEVFFPLIKEPNFYSATDMNAESFQEIYRRDIDIEVRELLRKKREWHTAHITSKDEYESLYMSATNERWLGDASVSYLWSPGAAERISSEYPKAKIIAVLREPAERAFSHFLMNKREGKTNFGDFIKEVESDYRKSEKGWGVSHQYVELSLYFEKVKRYFAAFPQNQILVLPYQMLKSSPDHFLSELEGFLDLKDALPRQLPKANQSATPRWPGLNEQFQKKG